MICQRERFVDVVSREPEEPWASAMLRVKATNPRDGRPSWNQLAALSGLHTTTITNLVYGKSKPKVETIRALAEALRVPAKRVAGWLDAPEVGEPYAVPSEVELLSPRQQRALTELIRAMADRSIDPESGESSRRDRMQVVQTRAARDE